MKKISLIIPHYNSAQHLRVLLDSLVRCSMINDCEVLVVDDHSPQDPAITFGKIYPDNFIFLRMEKNSGPAAARNFGASKANAAFLLFLDADTAVYEDTLQKVVQASERQEVFIGVVSQEPMNDRWFQRYKTCLELFWLPSGEYSTVADTKVLGIRTLLFQQSGGFNGSYLGADVEDYEFGYRLMDMGKKIALEKEICVRHHYADLLSFSSKCFRRVKLWVPLNKLYARDFDDHGTSLGVALGQLFAFLTLVFLVMAFLKSWFLFAALATLVIFFLFTLRFWRILFSREKNPLFACYALFCYLFTSIPVMTGAATGYLSWYLAPGKNIKEHELHSF
jgi:glycosyltransferase involved in cell wall biosynthesis